MVLRGTQEAEAFFGNFEVTGTDFDWAVVIAIAWVPRVSRIARFALIPLIAWVPSVAEVALAVLVLMPSVLMMMSVAHDVRTGPPQSYSYIQAAKKNPFRIGNAVRLPKVSG